MTTAVLVPALVFTAALEIPRVATAFSISRISWAQIRGFAAVRKHVNNVRMSNPVDGSEIR